MYTTINKNRLFSLITRTAAVTFFAASATLVLHAQQSAGTSSSSSLSPLSLQKTLAAPPDLTVPDDLNYSSSVGEPELAAAENFNLTGSEERDGGGASDKAGKAILVDRCVHPVAPLVR